MINSRFTGLTELVVGIILAAFLSAGCAVKDESQETAVSRIAIVIDETLSFQKNLPTAAKIVARFIRENALSGDSEVYLIAMDRNPQVINHYRASEVLDTDGNEMLNAIKKPSDHDGTDVVGALRLGLFKLNKENGVKINKRYLLVFSDLHVDPATIGMTGQKKAYPALEEFEWSELKSLEQARFCFISKDLEYRVTELLAKNGVSCAQVLDPAESRRLVLQREMEEQN